MFDTDGGGSIDPKELKAAMTSLGKNNTKKYTGEKEKILYPCPYSYMNKLTNFKQISEYLLIL